jgi:hypothetical protein
MMNRSCYTARKHRVGLYWSNSTTALGIFLLTFAAFALLAPQSPDNPQVITRLGLTLSIVESGRLDIDRFADRTKDKALFGGHFYSDKVPGLSFLAIPVVAATAHLINAVGNTIDPNKPADFARFATAVSIAVNGLISALAIAALFLTAIRLGATRTGALFAAGALAFATPFLGWSTAFLAHSVSGSLLIFAAAVITFAFAGDPPVRPRRPTLFGLGVGMLLGYTLVVDLTAAPACLLGGIVTLALASRGGGEHFVQIASGIVLGGVLGLLPLLVYNQLAFGSPLTLGYSAVVGFEGMQQGFFGITWPSPGVVVQLLFGLYRGLLPLSPILVLVPVGFYVMWQAPSTRVMAAAILGVFCSFLWINASYFYWWGGASLGPRHLVQALPLCCLALAFAWPRGFWARSVTLVLLVASLVLSMICAVTDIFAPARFRNPLIDFFLPAFLTPEKLLKSLPIVLGWVLFGLLFFCRIHSTDIGLTLSGSTVKRSHLASDGG